MEVKTYNCGGAHCTTNIGEVRTLPTGGDTNAILCFSCYSHEIKWRKERNKELAEFAKFDIPLWNQLKIYMDE